LNLISWMCVKYKCDKCKGKLETDILYVIVSKTGYSCVPKLARMKVRVKLDINRKKNRENVSVRVHTIYKGELIVRHLGERV